MKDVKKLLKSQKDSILPDKDLKHKIARDLGISAEGGDKSFRSGNAAVKVRRNVFVAVASVTAAAIAAASVAVWFTSRSDGDEFIPLREFQFGTVSSATDFYAYGAVSMGSLLTGYGETTVSQSYCVKASEEVFLSDESLQDGGLNDDQKAKVENYFVFATGILGGGKIESSVKVSDRAQYSYKLSADYADSFGIAANYVLYFNAKDDVKKDKYALEGILIVGENVYPVEGKYKSESDEGETENEISFKAFTANDKNSYISLQYETEISGDETESGYSVKVIEDGRQVEKASVSHETEEGQTSFEIKIQNDDGDVKLEFEDFGEGFMGVTADFGGEQHKFGMAPVPPHEGGGFRYEWGFNGDKDDFDKDFDKDDKDDGDFVYPPEPENPDKDFEDFGNPPEPDDFDKDFDEFGNPPEQDDFGKFPGLN